MQRMKACPRCLGEGAIIYPRLGRILPNGKLDIPSYEECQKDAYDVSYEPQCNPCSGTGWLKVLAAC